jgi:type IV pilus assembly protein PilW
MPHLLPHRRRQRTHQRGQRGFSLIELMVALVIGMVLTLAVFATLAAWEGRKRITTGVNDLEQAGNLALYQLDTLARSAGSGFASAAAMDNSIYGCLLHATSADGQTLPRTAALPAPFAAVDLDGEGNFPLLPVMILPGATEPGESGEPSDALLVMGGTAAQGGGALSMAATPAEAALTLENTLGFRAGDLLLLADNKRGRNCLLTQVDADFSSDGGKATALPLGGSFHAAAIGGMSIASSFDPDSAMVVPMGAPGTQAPQFLLIGVGDHNTLFSYDLLQTSGADSALQARAEGVFELHALYGVDTDGDGSVDDWASAESGDYTVDALMDGSTAAKSRLLRIKTVRVGLLLRTTLPEKTAEETSTPDTLVLFSDLAKDLQVHRQLDSEARRYRYRVMEATLLVRNNLALKG